MDYSTPAYRKEEIIRHGYELVQSGQVNPIHEMQQAERTEGRYIGKDSVAVFRAWGHRLQRNADAIAATFSTNNPRFGEAEKAFQNWQARIDKVVKPTVAQMMHSFQGFDLFGENGQMSVTFVRDAARRAKAKRTGRPEGSVELDPEERELIDILTGKVNEAAEQTTEIVDSLGEQATNESTQLDKGQQTAVTSFEDDVTNLKNAGFEKLRGLRGGKQPMAMKGKEAELPPLNPEEADILGNIGMSIRMELSKKNQLTDANWEAEMKKQLFEKLGHHEYDPYVPHLRAVSEQLLAEAVNNRVGTGSAMKDAREVLTRKRPPIEVSKQAIIEALKADPEGRNITPAEAYHIWNYLDQKFLRNPDPSKRTLDFRKIRMESSADLGIKDSTGKITQPYDQLRLFRAMASRRSMRKATQELTEKMRNEARLKVQAINWLKNQEFPKWLRTMRLFPRLFFLDKIAGHGLVPMITHAPDMMFNPRAWEVYFGRPKFVAKMTGKPHVKGAWLEMYRMTFGSDVTGRLKQMAGVGEWKGETASNYHENAMRELTENNRERFEFWKSMDLECDPFRLTDDYQIEGLQNLFAESGVGPRFDRPGLGYRALRAAGLEKSAVGRGVHKFIESTIAGRGFDALKTLRFAMAEKWFNSLPDHLQNEESARLIADSVNHATGIVKTQFHEAFNWAMFAPKLEASRWAYMFKDPIKALNYVANWKEASMEQRHWAKSELQQKAMVASWYLGMLTLNQAMLWATGSEENINGIPEALGGKGFDPTKSDFMAFKVGGFKVGVLSPMIGVLRLLANALHVSFLERTKYERLTPRREALGEEAWDYATGKASPFASFVLQGLAAQDFQKRPIGFLPWSEPLPRAKRLAGVRPYEFGEYMLQQFAPIPLEEAIKSQFKMAGMDELTASSWIRALIASGAMGLTGARVQELQK